MCVCRNTKDRNEIAHDNEEKSGIKSKEKKNATFQTDDVGSCNYGCGRKKHPICICNINGR